MKITLLYDKFENNLPLRNCDYKEVSKTFVDFKHSGINFITVRSNSFKQRFVNAIYPLDIDHMKFDEIVNKIPISTKHILIKYKIPILIWWASEGLDLSKYDYWLEKISYHFGKEGFKENKKYLISGNMKIEKLYDDLDISKIIENNNCFNTYENFLKFRTVGKLDGCFSLDYWEEEHRYYYEQTHNIDLLRENSDNFFNYDIKKSNFLFYNNRMRPHRIALLSEIFRFGLNGNSFISCWETFKQVEKPDYFIYCTEPFFQEESDSLNYFRNFILNLRPLKILDENVRYEDLKGGVNGPEHFIKSWFSIVSETEFSNDSTFLTEKSWKPIANYHPFIVWGAPGTLEYLRNRGYETCYDIFDETYDQEIDPRLRLKMVVSEIQKFCRLPIKKKIKKLEEIKPKLIHNRNFYFSVNRRTKRLEEILSIIIEEAKGL